MRLTRKQAKMLGRLTYEAGRECARRHRPVRRYVKNGSCAWCTLEHSYAQFANPETRAKRYAAARRYYAANRDAVRKRNREWRKKNFLKVRTWQRRAAGLPEPTRKEPNRCECCGRSANGRALQLDHCHGTDRFRGWLCRGCNFGIGALGDTAVSVRRALRYLTSAVR